MARKPPGICEFLENPAGVTSAAFLDPALGDGLKALRTFRGEAQPAGSSSLQFPGDADFSALLCTQNLVYGPVHTYVILYTHVLSHAHPCCLHEANLSR